MNQTAATALVAAISAYQTRYRLTDKLMAERLHVSRTRWVAIRNGKYPPSLDFAQAAYRLPEFRARAEALLIPVTR